jgi:hypothetical protein
LEIEREKMAKGEREMEIYEERERSPLRLYRIGYQEESEKWIKREWKERK